MERSGSPFIFSLRRTRNTWRPRPRSGRARPFSSGRTRHGTHGRGCCCRRRAPPASSRPRTKPLRLGRRRRRLARPAHRRAARACAAQQVTPHDLWQSSSGCGRTAAAPCGYRAHAAHAARQQGAVQLAAVPAGLPARRRACQSRRSSAPSSCWPSCRTRCVRPTVTCRTLSARASSCSVKR